MIVSEAVIVSMAVYFFLKVLFAKPRPEPDSYTDNDADER